MTAFKDWLNGLTSKSTPVDADEVYVRDSSGTPSSKKLTWANLKATLASTFLPLTGGTLAGGTVTASAPVLATTQTWDNAAVTFIGKSNVFTNTASAAGAILERWVLGAVSALEITKSGIKIGNLSGADSGGEIRSSVAYRSLSFYATTAGSSFEFSNGFLELNGTTYADISFGNGSSSNSPHIRYGAAGVLHQRSGAQGQSYFLFGTYTDSSNGRWIEQSMTSAGVGVLKPTGNGTGATGNVLHISGLPTTNPGPGILWNDTGTVKVGT